MKTLKLTTLSLLFSLIFFSCSTDDDNQDSPNTTDFNTTINENPIEGLLVGTITTSNTSTKNYAILSQTPNDALRVDPETGNLIVNNALVFDFETNPSITAIVRDLAGNNTTNVTINLNNIDDIAHFLTTSKANYLAADESSWTIITEAEYNLLAERLNQVSTLGTTNSDYQTAGATSIDNVTATNVGGSPNLPANNYFFGFKYHAMSDNVVGARVKISGLGPLYGFIGAGRHLPDHDMGDNYFVLKNGPISTNEGYIAVFTPGEIGHINSTPDKTCYAANDDVTSIPSVNIAAEIIYLYQGLFTPQNQWGE